MSWHWNSPIEYLRGDFRLDFRSDCFFHCEGSHNTLTLIHTFQVAVWTTLSSPITASSSSCNKAPPKFEHLKCFVDAETPILCVNGRMRDVQQKASTWDLSQILSVTRGIERFLIDSQVHFATSQLCLGAGCVSDVSNRDCRVAGKFHWWIERSKLPNRFQFLNLWEGYDRNAQHSQWRSLCSLVDSGVALSLTVRLTIWTSNSEDW